MATKRAQILSRIKGILDEAVVANILSSAHRNRGQLEKLPGKKGLLLDGDEVVRLSTRGHEDQQSGLTPANLMVAIPEIWFLLDVPKTVENVGKTEEYELIYETFIPLIMRDSALLALLDVASGGQIEYLGFETDLKNEHPMLGQMRLDFGFTYVFDPDEL